MGGKKSDTSLWTWLLLWLTTTILGVAILTAFVLWLQLKSRGS